MMDNNFASVGAIVIKDKQVLLVRHTYGPANGKLLNPGGHLLQGEMPADAVKREVFEETGVIIDPIGMLSVRCAKDGWYMVFLAEYVAGTPISDNKENSEALFMDYDEVLKRDDATDTVKTLIKLALNGKVMKPIDAGKGRVLFAVGEYV
ncbi:MAG TPA: NUDIX hydrolase [Thermoclostridium sp.]